MTPNRLAGKLSVDDSAGRIRRYRWLEERLMRILGGWMALTPELPVKILFGRHVWDCAQHADLWGRRLPELRAPAHRGEPPSDGFAHLVELVDGLQARHETVARVVAVYRVLKPHLITAYERHLADANPIYEPLTRRILARCLEEERRHVAAGTVVLKRLTASGDGAADEWERRLTEELGRVEGLVRGPAAPALPSTTPDVRGDLVALDSAFDAARIDEDLAGALERHRRALLDGDLDAAVVQVTPHAREALLAVYRAAGRPRQASVVACARVGSDYRFTKLALRTSRGAAVVQLEWRRVDAGWQVTAVELVRSEPAG